MNAINDAPPRVAVLLGKFDPPTTNKFEVLQVAEEECKVRYSFLVPYSGPTDRAPKVSYQDRLFMCSLAVQEQGERHRLGILPVESWYGRQDRVETYRAICAHVPAPPLLVMGADRIPVLLKAGQFEEIKAMAPVFFVRRDDHFKIGDSLAPFAEHQVSSAEDLRPGKFMVSNGCVDGTSSGKIRLQIWKGKKTNDMIDAVKDYTERFGWRLYPRSR